MNSNQQQETLNYFRKFATDWMEKATVRTDAVANVIKQRNDFVSDIMEKYNYKSLLDIGCGTGDLVLDCGKKDKVATGIDFSKEMIDIANSRLANLKNVKFLCGNFFETDFSNVSFDLISANGFIEYISFKELNSFMDYSSKKLSSGGGIVLGSRNRLFNIFSLNQFTVEEFNSNAIELLVQESVEVCKMKSPMDLLNIKTVENQKSDQTHAHTGIEVTTRFQYTPAQLVQLFNKYGFKTIEIVPIHIHATNPVFNAENTEVHNHLSAFLHNLPLDKKKLIPTSSTFMIYGKKN
jgi:ubiquinone/menaquinone biosynthesis C-methylase UbiE